MQPRRFPDQKRPLATELWVLAAALVALLAWEVSGLDLSLARLYGDASGFALRDWWLARSVLHDAVRWISAACIAGMACDVLRSPGTGPTRAQRAYWLMVVVLTLVLIPLLKRITMTSCPWDMAEFGGIAAYVPHWRPGISDGGPGHCFPAGHPVSAFAFLGLYYLWHASRPRLASMLLILVLCAGTLLGWAQMARGAHFASHVLWSAWLAAAVAVAGRYFEPRWRNAGADTPRIARCSPNDAVPGRSGGVGGAMPSAVHDYFISYKHADASALAASLNKALAARQYSVWLDQEQIAPGDSILSTIELGLSSSIDALVLISPNYFSGWAEQERRALFSKMASGRFRIVPILYGVTAAELAARSPMFADISALVAPDASDATAELLAQRLVDTSRPDRKELRLYEIFFRCVLQHRGYDADIALFLGVFEDNPAAIEEAMARGGNPAVNAFDIFKRYWRDAVSFGCWEEWRKLFLHLSSTGKLEVTFPGNADGATTPDA